MIAYETSTHQSSNKVNVSNYKHSYGIQQCEKNHTCIVSSGKPRHEEDETVKLRKLTALCFTKLFTKN